MAWTQPKTWATGELVKELDLNQQIYGNQTLLKTSLTDDGKIIALSATYLENLDGSALTGIPKLASTNVFTAGKQNFNGGTTTRVVLPVGADKWAT